MKTSIVALFLCAFLIFSCSAQFSRSPNVEFYAGQNNATVIRVSQDEDEVTVGFTNGYLKTYDMDGYWMSTKLGQTSKIIDIEYLPDGSFISLSQSGTATRWGRTGSSLNTWNLQGNPIDMSVTTNSVGQWFVAFNLGDKIEEYRWTGSFVKTYYPNSAYNFTAIQYVDYQYLVAGMSDSYVRSFYCSSGSLASYSVSTYGKPIKMSYVGDGQTVIVMTQYSSVYKIIANNYYSSFGSFTTARSLTACPNSGYFVMAESNYYDLGVYDTVVGSFYQYLSYMDNTGVDVDCGNTYLVSVDASGYVYYTTRSSFPGWAIGLISGAAFFILVVTVICCISQRRRARRRAQAMGNYNNIDKVPPPQQPYFNNGSNNAFNGQNQGFNNNGNNNYVNANQGFNNNQGYANNNNSNGAPNPYQTNPPRNWN